jgi:hypothetical protein
MGMGSGCISHIFSQEVQWLILRQLQSVAPLKSKLPRPFECVDHERYGGTLHSLCHFMMLNGCNAFFKTVYYCKLFISSRLLSVLLQALLKPSYS